MSNMKHYVITMDEHPIRPGEEYFIVHPNNAECVLSFPEGTQTMCTKDLRLFEEGTLYVVTGHTFGWVTVACSKEVVKMPEYVYARHFDAETFVVNRNFQYPTKGQVFTD